MFDQVSGWVAIGLGADGLMANSDIILAFVNGLGIVQVMVPSQGIGDLI